MISIYDYTPLIKFTTNEYPKFYYQMRQENPTFSFGFPGNDITIRDFGYAYVNPTDRPNGDVVEEGFPEYKEIEDEWYQTWQVRDFTAEEIEKNLRFAKDQILTNAKTIFNTDKNNGVQYTYKGVKHNISVISSEISLMLSIKALIEDYNSEEKVLFKFSDNGIVEMSQMEYIDFVKNIFNLNYTLHKKYWEFISLVESKNLITELPQVPDTFNI